MSTNINPEPQVEATSSPVDGRYYDLGVGLRRGLAAAKQFAQSSKVEIKDELQERKQWLSSAYDEIKAGYKA